METFFQSKFYLYTHIFVCFQLFILALCYLNNPKAKNKNGLKEFPRITKNTPFKSISQF